MHLLFHPLREIHHPLVPVLPHLEQGEQLVSLPAHLLPVQPVHRPDKLQVLHRGQMLVHHGILRDIPDPFLHLYIIFPNIIPQHIHLPLEILQ